MAVKGGQISALGHPCQEVEVANPRLKLSDNDTLTLHRTKLAWGPNSLRLQWERLKKKKEKKKSYVSFALASSCMFPFDSIRNVCILSWVTQMGAMAAKKDFRQEIKPRAMLTTSCSGTLVLFVDCILNIENYLYTGLMDKKKKVAEQILI